MAALAAVALLAVPVLLGAGDRPSWRPASLPPAIRGRVHLQARSVPAFPMNDRRYLKPAGWPRALTIGGVPCVLRIYAWEDDDAMALSSIADAEPGTRLMLFYDAESSPAHAAIAGWGPRYLWNEHGKLMQRIWYEPDSSRLVTHDYTYYQGGQLLGYSRRSEPRRHARVTGRPYEFLSEFYEKDGRLMAIAYENMKPHARDSVYAWMGSVVSYGQFRMKSHVLYSSAHPGNR